MRPQFDPFFLITFRVEVRFLHVDEHEFRFVLALFSSLLALLQTYANNAFLPPARRTSPPSDPVVLV